MISREVGESRTLTLRLSWNQEGVQSVGLSAPRRNRSRAGGETTGEMDPFQPLPTPSSTYPLERPRHCRMIRLADGPKRNPLYLTMPSNRSLVYEIVHAYSSAVGGCMNRPHDASLQPPPETCV